VPPGVLGFDPDNQLTYSNAVLPISILPVNFKLPGEYRLQISQRLLICPSYRRVPMMNMILEMTAMICPTVAIQRANPYSG
jgi:hypothetical protein